MEISKCSQDYIENRCHPSDRVRALEDFCIEKEKCMNRDPLAVNKNTKIMVKLLAEIINDFFEPLTFKAISLVVIVLGMMLFVSEFVVGRRNNQYIPQSFN